MANKQFSGYLRDPLSPYASKDQYRFTHASTTGQVIKGSRSYLEIGEDGFYDITIEYGNVVVESRADGRTQWIMQGVVTINSDTTATTLPALLNALIPTTPDLVLELEALLADAEEAAAIATAAAEGFIPATTTEAQIGTNDVNYMTPLKTRQSIEYNTGSAASRDVVSSTADATTGRVLTVGYGGLGGSRISKQTFGNDLVNVFSGSSEYNGMIVEVAVDTANKPSIARSDVAGFASVNGTTLIFTAIFPTSELGNVYTGIYSGTELTWRSSYDSGNTNFNDFGGVGTSDLIATGFAFNSSAALFNLPINSITSPSGISVTGMFEVRNQNALLASGAVPTITTSTSNKMLSLVVSGLGDVLTAGESLRLITESATSKITVNY